MKITFVLPGIPRIPVGGFKMVFEYANRLSRRGHDVVILYHCYSGMRRNLQVPKLFKLLYYCYGAHHFPSWFELDAHIKIVWQYKKLVDSNVPDADIICATAIDTAYEVAALSESKGKKIYFIQDYEAWNHWSDEQVKQSYLLGMKNIVIAKWLYQIVKNAGSESVLIPNGIDFDAFGVDIPISKRKKRVISMLYHLGMHKGSRYGIQALLKLKQKYPDLQAVLFGSPKRPHDLPGWMYYVHNASQSQLRTIYNQSLIYMCPSVKEGFGLTGAEAMACGAAYVASDYGGVHEYAEEGRSVLLSAPKDVDGLVHNISILLNHDDKRIQLAENGNHDIRKLDWNHSVNKLETIMTSMVNEEKFHG